MDRRPANPPSIRRAGLLQALGMAVGAWLLGRHGHPVASLALRALAAVVAALALTRPAWLAATRRALGRAVTVALLGAVYVVVLVPTRALLAALRVDPLAPPRREAPGSHWITRDAADFAPEDFERTS